MKSFTEEEKKTWNYQEAFKYTEEDVTNLIKKGSIEIKLEAWLKSTSINKLIEELEKAKFYNSEEYHTIVK